MAARKKMTDKELQDLGRNMQRFYELGYVNKKQMLSYSFLKGIATGFGVFLGGTIVVALLLWVLGFFDQVPFVHHLAESVRQSTQSK